MRIGRQQKLKSAMRKRIVRVIAAAAMLALIGGLASLAPPNGATRVSAGPVVGTALSPSPTTALVGQSVTFSASASSNVTLSQFSFNFGDGGTAIIPASGTTATVTANHVYTAANTYLASVTASDSSSASNTATASVVVGAAQKLSVTPSSPTSFAVVDQPIPFSATVTDPNPGATISNIMVNFGDGSASMTVPNGTAVSHAFLVPGNFSVTFTGTDSLGNTGTAALQIAVSGGLLPNNGFYNPVTGAYNASTTGSYFNPATGTYVPFNSAAAATGTVSVSMAQGWDIVGGPAGTIITGNEGPLYTYQASDTSYEVVQPGTPLRAGVGYWAYFTASMSNLIPLAPGQSMSIPLAPSHWEMIANPGSGTATVSGVDYMVVFNTSSGQYVQTTTLGPGQGAWGWSWNGGTGTVTSS